VAGSRQSLRVVPLRSFGDILRRQRHTDDLTQAELAKRFGVSPQTISSWERGDRPQSRFLNIVADYLGLGKQEFISLLNDQPEESSSAEAEEAFGPEADGSRLLFRIYIPSGRLYAAEAHRLLPLFREWLIATGGWRVQQISYRTASGEMYEFYIDSSFSHIDPREGFDAFTRFLGLCVNDPATAVESLSSISLERQASEDLVARFGREARGLEIELRHERERRIMTLRHSLEEELVYGAADFWQISSGDINRLLQRLIPGPSAPESFSLLAAPWTIQPNTTVTMNINQQVISAVESTIIQNIEGTLHLGPQAKELLELIDRFGGSEQAELQSAVHELEDAAAPSAARSAAKRRLKKFLLHLADTVKDVGVDLLEKYLESKAGL
jgi:transcriptional regulator with XRE-family HTH domain